MPNSINQVTLLGNLTKDPETKQTQGGITIARISLATNHSVKKGDEWEDVAEFHNVVAFGKTAEYVEKTCQKGTKMHVTGRLKTSSWDDEETGKKRFKTEIMADQVIVLDKRKAKEGFDEFPEDSKPLTSAKEEIRKKYAEPEIGIADIPF